MSVDLEPRTDEPSEELFALPLPQPGGRGQPGAGVVVGVGFTGLGVDLLPVCGVCWLCLPCGRFASAPTNWAGRAAAQTGLILSAVLLGVGPSPPDHRAHAGSARGLRPDQLRRTAARPARLGEQIPNAAKELDGKKVFIKGYVYPGREKNGIRTFLLVRDQGDCCFGGDPKITDRILVTLKRSVAASATPRLHKLAGVFHVARPPRRQLGRRVLSLEPIICIGRPMHARRSISGDIAAGSRPPSRWPPSR